MNLQQVLIHEDVKKSWICFIILHDEKGLTTILVTHSMEDAARYADHVAIMHEGTLCHKRNILRKFLRDEERLAKYRLDVTRCCSFSAEDRSN